LKFGGSAEFGASDPMTAEHIQAYLGHKNIQHTVRYTELAPTRFKDFWRD
jgi:site-specific recombinase XerD